MEKEFIVFYEHAEYGYFTADIEAEDIVKALNDFNEYHAHNGIYGIMEKK